MLAAKVLNATVLVMCAFLFTSALLLVVCILRSHLDPRRK